MNTDKTIIDIVNHYKGEWPIDNESPNTHIGVCGELYKHMCGNINVGDVRCLSEGYNESCFIQVFTKAEFDQCVVMLSTLREQAHHIAITIEALGSQPVHHIDLAVTAGAVQDVREVDPDRSMGGPVSMPTFEFSEPTMTEVIMPDGERRTVGMVMCHEKPIYTQEMAKHRQAAPIGSSVQTSMGEGVVVAHGVSYGRSQVVIQTNETMLSLDDSQYYPLDSRTDEDKAIDALIKPALIFSTGSGSYKKDAKAFLETIKAGEIHGVKWVGK